MTIQKKLEEIKKRDEIIEKVAKGYVQQSIAYDMLVGKEIIFSDYIKAKHYYNRYIQSFLNLFDRFEKIGYAVKITMGKNGGYWTATAKLA